ncbi:hypothetical protein FBUS_10354 [Fasciolopsis buskii]|uniref:Uncharacterized protein n=1 Tax=Fasciolopsis buskii TaxID=27845 RepID=A0A8E0S4X0_9TREM|nr:hypothetical protein FBUS_10354 [Fasciolopsis buski]
MANSAVHRATELINSVKTRLESPGPVRHRSFPPRRSSSVDRVSVNVNNAEINSFETCSLQTTSTSSSAHSGFLNFALPTTVNQNDPLPQPTCRLGPFQAEWLSGPNATWRLVTQDATMSPLDQADAAEPGLKSLLRANKALKKEQGFLRTKLNVLYDELAKRTALVHSHERKLEKLRSQVRQKMPNNLIEGMRSDMRRELEHKLEAERLRTEKKSFINLTSKDETNQPVKKTAGHDLGPRADVPDSLTSNHGDEWETTDEDSEKVEEKSGQSESCLNAEQKKPSRKRVDWSESTTEESTHNLKSGQQRGNKESSVGLKINSDSSSASTTEDVTGDETNEHDTTGDESQTATTKASDSGTLEDEDEVEEESASSVTDDGTDDEDAEDEQELDQQETSEEEEEDLSKTDESSKTEGRLSCRPRVVQFGKVSRR